MQGGLARYINHSCEPNCETRVIKTIGAVKHIAIFSKQFIPAGTELCYDYKVHSTSYISHYMVLSGTVMAGGS